MTDGDNTIRTSPEIPEKILNDFKTTIQLFNNAKLKGRLSPTIAEAMQLYMVAMHAREPDKLKNIEQHVDIDDLDYLDDPEEFCNRVIEYQNELSGSVQQIAHQLQRDTPGGPTRLEQYLTLDDTVESTTQDTSSQLESSLLTK